MVLSIAAGESLIYLLSREMEGQMGGIGLQHMIAVPGEIALPLFPNDSCPDLQ